MVPISKGRNMKGLKGFQDESENQSEMEHFIRFVSSKKFTLIKPQTILSHNLPGLKYNMGNPFFVSVIEDLYHKQDMDNDGFVTAAEFGVVARSLGLKQTATEFDNILNLFEPKTLDGSRPVGLSLMGFKAFFENFIDKMRPTKEWVAERLLKLGYDEDFFSFQSRVFAFGVYSKETIRVTSKDALKGD